MTDAPRLRLRQRGRAGPLLWLLVVATVLAAGGYLWWRHAPDTLPGFVRDMLPRSPQANPPLYRWRDDQGRVQITDRPPPDDRPYETLHYDPDTNVVPNLDGKPRD